MKEDLFDTRLPVLKVNKNKIGRCLGIGNEGEVYRYGEYAIKKIYHKNLDKNRKIERLGVLSDKNFLFPLGFFGYESLYQEGYYMEEVHFGEELRDFDDLVLLNDIKRKLKIIKEADNAIRRAHESGIIIGDIKGDNILIDEDDNPRFGDTDNYKVGEYDFDLAPKCKDWLSYAYGTKENLLESDKFVWAILVLETIFKVGDLYNQHSTVYLGEIIRVLDVSKETREILNTIFSDTENRPYIGEIIDSKMLSLK